MIQKLAVLGAGSWGTALAIHAAKNCPQVILWGHRREHVERMHASRCNQQYLPDYPFPDHLCVTADLTQALEDADAVLISVPSKAFDQTLARMKSCVGTERQLPILYATKGLEHGTGKFLHDVIESHFKSSDYPYAILSGPSFAKEVAIGLPTAVVIASYQTDISTLFRTLFHHDGFRIYTNTDVIGVEVGGAYKNVIAIAAGISDGLGFGANARAALITRGLAEMKRLGMAVGAKSETFMGLAGLGDLLLTATDNQSRNRRFGLALGQGVDVRDAEQNIGQVVEGASTSIEILRLAAQYEIELPIVYQVNQVIYKGLSARDAVIQLLNRDPKKEA